MCGGLELKLGRKRERATTTMGFLHTQRSQCKYNMITIQDANTLAHTHTGQELKSGRNTNYCCSFIIMFGIVAVYYVCMPALCKEEVRKSHQLVICG